MLEIRIWCVVNSRSLCRQFRLSCSCGCVNFTHFCPTRNKVFAVTRTSQQMFELQSFSSNHCSLVIDFSRRQLKFLNRGGGSLRWEIEIKIPGKNRARGPRGKNEQVLWFTLRKVLHKLLPTLPPQKKFTP